MPHAQSCCFINSLCKRTQHCWPTTPSIVGCYVLRPFAHPVPCHCVLLGVFVQSLNWTVQTLSYVQTDPTTPNIVGPAMLGVVASACTWLNYTYLLVRVGVNTDHDCLLPRKNVFVRPRFCSPFWRTFWNDGLSVTVFTEYVSTVGQIKLETKNVPFHVSNKNRYVCARRALASNFRT